MKLISFCIFLIPVIVLASTPITKEQLNNISKTNITNDEQREQLSKTAGLLSEYEIKARKLVSSLSKVDLNSEKVISDAEALLILSTSVIDSARFRLPQCEVYLKKTMELKDYLSTISHETLEKDYHHDGALPKAPVECYHTKDLYVHPATVMVLVRDDPDLLEVTRDTIADEINEVLAHTEIVRELVIY